MSFLLFSCVFRWFWRDLVKCYVSVQVMYLLDNLGFIIHQILKVNCIKVLFQ